MSILSILPMLITVLPSPKPKEKPKPAPKSTPTYRGGGGSSTKPKTYTYTYRQGDKPPSRSDYTSSHDYSRASYAYSKGKRAVTISRVKAGESLSSSELRGAGIQTTSGGGYRYYDSATKSYVTTAPPKAAEVKAEPKAEYYYQPNTGAITKSRVVGQRGMTQEQAQYFKSEYKAKGHTLMKGVTPFVKESGEPLTKLEYKKEYDDYLRARKAAREPTAQKIVQDEAPSLAGYMKTQAQQVPERVVEKDVSYAPTALGGLHKAWDKLRTVPDIVWEKAKEKYTPRQLVKGAQDIGKFSEQLQKTIKVKEVKDVGVKAKEKATPVVGVISKGFQWAKGEFWPEIKTEAQKFKGIRDWNKDMEKIENVFLKAREGYVFAETKAKQWKPEPIVKQPAFLKGIDPYKGFREQTKKQVVGVAQIGKVTMGATTGIVEDIKLKPYKLPLIYATGVVAGPVATKILGTGKVAKVAAVGFGATLATGIGVQAAMTPPGIEREKLIGVKAAEIAAFIGGAKYGIKKKPLAELYKSRIREPRFEKSIAKWQKEITAKDWGYLEKRAFIPSKKMPQRTLYGEPISPTKIKWLRAEVRPGYYGMDIARYKVTGYDTKFFQKHLTNVYSTKAIDWRYPKVVSITPKTMVTKGYRGILGTQPEMFTFKKPPLTYRADITKFDTSVQTMLAPKVMKVTKYDRPFYISKPKLPKPVKLGKPSKITPVHITPKHTPVKIKAADLIPTVSARPVVTVPTPTADVGAVLGTIPKGEALTSAISLSGMRFGVRDLTGALSSQFGAARQRVEQKQATKLGQELDKATKQETRQAGKTKPIVKVIPKLAPIVKVTPILKIPTKQIPKLRQPVPTVPFFPQPTYPIHKEPKSPTKRVPLGVPEFKWPTGIYRQKALKPKKYKRKFKYQPSLVAGMKRITTKEMKIPKYLTGVGIRPVKF